MVCKGPRAEVVPWVVWGKLGVRHREEQGHDFPAYRTPQLFEGFCRLVQGQEVMINLPGAVILSLSECVQLELPT